MTFKKSHRLGPRTTSYVVVFTFSSLPYHSLTVLVNQRSLPFRTRKDFKSLCPKATPAAIDFMEKCLTLVYSVRLKWVSKTQVADAALVYHRFSPSKRMTVQEALAHPYLDVSLTSELPSHNVD